MSIYDDQLKRAAQARKLAEALAQSKSPEGSMVSGHYVGPGWAKQLAYGIDQYQGAKGMSEADAMERQASTDKQDKLAELLGAMPKEHDVNQITDTGTQSLVTGTQHVKPSDEEVMAHLQKVQAVDPVAAQFAMSMYEKNATRDLADKTLSANISDKKEARTQAADLAREQMRQRSEDTAAQRQNALLIAQGNQGLQRELANLKIGNNGSPKLNPTIEKEIFQADELANASQNTVSLLSNAKELNKKPTYSGYGATSRAAAVNNLPKALGGQSEEASNTIQLNNMMTGQALESLKATFGGNPTEGERAILLELQASADKTPEDRNKIIDRAIQMAEQRFKFHSGKASQLRSGDYFQQGNSPVPSPIKSSGGVIKYDAQGNRIQ